MPTFVFNDQWTISSTHGPILASEGSKRNEYEEKLATHHLPEMIFDQNILKLVHRSSQLELQFNAFDALKLIDHEKNLDEIPKVSMSEIWSKSRGENRNFDYVKPYDWTYTSRYEGSLISSNERQWRIESTDEILNYEKLKRQEPILFYDELTLYEDELADNGMSTLTLKIRCMPTGFFLLLRYFLRIDGVLIRCFDTRYHFEIEKNFILREFSRRESPISKLKSEFQSNSDVNAVISQLEILQQKNEKLFFGD